MATSKHHDSILERACRICGKLVARREKKQFNLASRSPETLLIIYDVDVSNDCPSIHPTHLCRSCMHKVYAQLSGRMNYRYSKSTLPPVFDWTPHSEVNCKTCSHEPQPLNPRKPPTVNASNKLYEDALDCISVRATLSGDGWGQPSQVSLDQYWWKHCSDQHYPLLAHPSRRLDELLPSLFVRRPWSVVRLASCVVRKLFTFPSSSPELVGRFQPNLVGIILWG